MLTPLWIEGKLTFLGEFAQIGVHILYYMLFEAQNRFILKERCDKDEACFDVSFTLEPPSPALYRRIFKVYRCGNM